MKHNFFQKWTSLVLAVLMVISLVPVFTITARAEGTQTYNKVALANIKATDTIIIVSTKGTASYAMSNDKGTGSAPAAVSVTVVNDTITTNASNILWNISNDNGNLTIYPAGLTDKWLYCTADNNGVRVGINANKVFTMDTSGYLKNTATSRYLGVYNNADWRCYKNTTGNTAGQTFSFYKLVENAEGGSGSECEHDWKQTSSRAATCTEAGYDVYGCSKCGTTEQRPTDAALGHDEVNHDAQAATCTSVGWDAYVTCSRCEYTTYVEIPKVPHNFVDGICTECKSAQPTTLTINRDSFGDASGYDWHGWSATATTGEVINGYGYIYGTTTSSIQMNSSKDGVHIYNTAALPGKIVSITLTAEKTTFRDFYVLTADTPYTNSSPDTTGATLKNVTTDGATWEFDTTDRYFVIVVTGGAAYLSSIEITYEVCSHANKVAIGKAKAATCTEDGITAGEKCADCGEVLTEQVVIPATGHKDENADGKCDICGTTLCTEHIWVDGEVKVEGDCTTDRVVAQVCQNCGEIGEDKVTTAPGHTVEIDAAVAATCTNTGLTEGSHCSVCGAVIVAQTTTDIIPHEYKDGACTMCGKAEPVLPFKVGDVVIFTGSKADGTDTQELAGFASDKTFGTAKAYAGTPVGKFPLTVVEGYQKGTFAFKNGDNYITCNGNKNVNLSTTRDEKSSWTATLDAEGNLVLVACSSTETTKYYLQYNSGDPRFTTYSTGSQQPIKIVKVEPTVQSVSLSLNKGVTVKVTMNIPEAWLTANKSAMVEFSNGVVYAAQAGENVYSVDLTPAQINDALTVAMKCGETIVFDATDVSVAAYRKKAIAAGNAEDSALIKLIDAALAYADAADGKGEDLADDFADVDDATVIHANDAKLFAGFSGVLSTYASVYVRVNAEHIQEGETLRVTLGGTEIYNGSMAEKVAGGYIVIDKLYPANFDEVISIDAKTEGSCAEFTFNSYLKAVYEAATNQQVKNFAVATYLYGLAAEAYLAPV